MQTPNILLSFSSDSGSGEAVDKATCGICRRQVSRYTCPSCNIPYCSLACFRSNEHAQCSEVFYKQQLETEIRTQPSASVEERRRMLEMLRKFEEGGAGDEGLFGGGDDDDDDEEREKDDLAERLGNIDIESASTSDIWNVLTPEEREAFLSKIRDPTSSSAQELLRSTGLDLDVILPWWGAPEVPEEDPSLPPATSKKYGKRPAMEEIPQSLLKRPAGPDSGPPLLYNICAVFVAYAYITRHIGVSPLSQAKDEDDRTSARQLIRELVPFVVEKRSTVLFNSMDDVVTYLWPRLVDNNKADRASFVVCLRDAARLLTPRRVALVESSVVSDNDNLDAAPQRDALAALSDLIALFKSRGQTEVKETPASLRLRFYAAHIATLPVQLLSAFSAEFGTRARSVEAEGESDVQSVNASFKPESKSSPSMDSTQKKAPLIEEV